MDLENPLRDSKDYNNLGNNLVIWFKTSIYLLGLLSFAALVYLVAIFKPVADLSLLHCVKVIQEEARLTSKEADLDLMIAKVTQDIAKSSK